MFLRRPTEKQIIKRSGLFDPVFYVQTYPDITAAGCDPLEHYLLHGRKEERKPCACFDPRAYLDANPDLDPDTVDPLLHYIREGKKTGRPLLARLPPLRRLPIERMKGMALTADQEASLAEDYGRLEAFIKSAHFAQEWQKIEEIEKGAASDRWHKVNIPPTSDSRYYVHREIRRRLTKFHYDTLLCPPSAKDGNSDARLELVIDALDRAKPGESILLLRIHANDAVFAEIESLDISDLLALLSDDQNLELLPVLLFGLSPRRIINLDNDLLTKTCLHYSRQLSRYIHLYSSVDGLDLAELFKSETDRESIPGSISKSEASPATSEITAVLILHREGPLCGPTLVNFHQAIEFARQSGITVEALIICDRPDALTESMARQVESGRVEVIDAGDPAHARNAAVAMAAGKYIAFLDGDDFWCEDWLVACRRYQAQLDRPTILHPAFNIYFGKTPGVMVHVDSVSPAFDVDSQRLANSWTSLCFAPREVWAENKYPPSDLAAGFGHEDWSWNSRTLATCIPHRPCPETFHVIRQRTASVSSERDAHRVIAWPTKLSSYK